MQNSRPPPKARSGRRRPHPAWRNEGHPDSQGDTEEKNEQNVGQRLLRSAIKKRLVQNAIDHVRMDFHTGVVETSVWRRSQIANACCGGADQYDSAAKRTGRDFLFHDVSE